MKKILIFVIVMFTFSACTNATKVELTEEDIANSVSEVFCLSQSVDVGEMTAEEREELNDEARQIYVKHGIVSEEDSDWMEEKLRNPEENVELMQNIENKIVELDCSDFDSIQEYMRPIPNMHPPASLEEIIEESLKRAEQTK